MSFSVFNEPPSASKRHRIDRKLVTKTDTMLMDYQVPENTSGLWYADIEGYLTPEISGEYEFGLCVYGQGQLFVDGKLVVDNSTTQRQGTAFFGCGTVEEKGVITVEKGKTYHVKVEYASAPTNTLGSGGVVRFGGGGFRIGGAFVIDPDVEINTAVKLAHGVDQVIICAGLNVSTPSPRFLTQLSLHTEIPLQADWETEGSDRQHMSLPGHVNEMISRVARANSSTAVVLQAGTPVEMPWIKDVATVVWAWYGGGESGNAISDILFGDRNPSGKTSLSFPKTLEDNPTFFSFKSERGRTLYGEDVYVGYRYYEGLRREVLFPFGHGLSYTTFEFSGLEVVHEKGAGNIRVSVAVENTGEREGAEVVQVYVTQRHPSIRRPKKELKGFTKLHLQPGERKLGVVEIETKYATSFWDEERDAWISEKDTYDVLVANTSAGNGKVLSRSFDIETTTWWKGL